MRKLRPKTAAPDASSVTPNTSMPRVRGKLHSSRVRPCIRRLVAYFQGRRSERMARPVIFTISAAWDNEASVWTGHCDDIPAAADAPTLDELLAKISAMALDLLPDNHPGVDPGDLFLQITALREAEPAAA
jgi:Domain of unknown function (DUF1902)